MSQVFLAMIYHNDDTIVINDDTIVINDASSYSEYSIVMVLLVMILSFIVGSIVLTTA